MKEKDKEKEKEKKRMENFLHSTHLFQPKVEEEESQPAGDAPLSLELTRKEALDRISKNPKQREVDLNDPAVIQIFKFLLVFLHRIFLRQLVFFSVLIFPFLDY